MRSFAKIKLLFLKPVPAGGLRTLAQVTGLQAESEQIGFVGPSNFQVFPTFPLLPWLRAAASLAQGLHPGQLPASEAPPQAVVCPARLLSSAAEP